MSRKGSPRSAERATAPEDLVLRFPYLLGGSRRFRTQSASSKLERLRRGPAGRSGMLTVTPRIPRRGQPFEVGIRLPRRKSQASLIRLNVRFPSGESRELDHRPTTAERRVGRIALEGFRSAGAGDFYVSARVYFSDGSTASDARVATVLSRNPDQLVISPRVWLVSGRAGRVEYDWDTDRFHCRAYGTITNGSTVARTFRTCRVRVTDGGAGGSEISSFSFGVGPFTVPPGGTAYRTVDTWYPKGGSVWDKFNQRWDLTVEFTYVADDGVLISDSAAYRPMSTVPVNPIKTTIFTANQTAAQRNAVTIASEILEDRDITLSGPNWRILSSQADRDRFGIIDVGWSDDYWDFDEAKDLYEQISGPEQDRLDVFIPVGFGYTDSVPADKRNVGGFSTVAGPFPKDDDPRRSACMVLLDENDQEFFGVAFAHEVCHYLGLEHVDAEDNLMHKNGGLTAHRLTWAQWDKVRQHGMMKWLAPDI